MKFIQITRHVALVAVSAAVLTACSSCKEYADTNARNPCPSIADEIATFERKEQ